MVKITHPFPLRPDVLATIEVPDDLTLEEVDRLCEHIRTLALDWEPAK